MSGSYWAISGFVSKWKNYLFSSAEVCYFYALKICMNKEEGCNCSYKIINEEKLTNLIF